MSNFVGLCVYTYKYVLNLMFYSIGGGIDYDSGLYNVTFPSGRTTVSFNVPINDDNVLEYDEQFDLTIISSSLPNGFTVDNPSQVVVTIIDNDSE